MFKRTLLAFAFMAVIGAASLGVSSKAQAWHDCDDRYAAAYPYNTYYATYGAAWAPRVAYYPAIPVRSYPVYYSRDYDRHHHHHRDHHNGLTISLGF